MNYGLKHGCDVSLDVGGDVGQVMQGHKFGSRSSEIFDIMATLTRDRVDEGTGLQSIDV